VTRRATILVVDDNDAGRYVKTRVLQAAGYRVTEAALGYGALECVTAKQPDLVLLDVKLPDIDGLSVCRRIKANFPHVIVLQTSARVVSGSDRVEALESGADSYLIEPIEPDELIGVVKALLRMRTAEQELRRLNQTLELRVAQRTHELAEANMQLAAEQAHHRKTQEVLWHTQRLEAVGQLTGGVAHDFNNLLTIITGNLELMELAVEQDSRLPAGHLLKLVMAAQNAAQHGAKMIQRLLAFGRRAPLRAETVELNKVIRAAEEFLRRALGETIELQLAFTPDLWPCWADQAQFEAAILNLVVNAHDAMPRGGRLNIAADNVEIDRITADGMDGLAPGRYVRICLSDTGIGMDEETRARAFEPFFTTKEVGQGSGLGLSQVYGFANQSGGYVAVDSTPGRGTSFSLYLPHSEARPKSRWPDTAETGQIPLGREKILVVEDNDAVLDVAVAMISDLGYEVITAVDGAAALALLQSDPTIELLFTDVVMPGRLSGVQLAETAREIKRDLQVLLTSGYPAADSNRVAGSNFSLITKPYKQERLARMLRALLDSHSRMASPIGEAQRSFHARGHAGSRPT
jgi:signal transduction histidine kinase